MKKLHALVLFVAILAGSLMLSSPASAKGGWHCYENGIVNYFATYGGQATISFIDPPVYEQTDCTLKGMLLTKYRANTKAEYLTLREFAKSEGHDRYAIGNLKMPVIWCKTSPTAQSGYMMDLSYFYTSAGNFTKPEEKNYATWAKRYVKKHTNCILFRR